MEVEKSYCFLMADGCSSAFHISFTTAAGTARPVTSTAIPTTSNPNVSRLNHNLDSLGVVYFTGIIEEVVIYHHYSGDVVVGVATRLWWFLCSSESSNYSVHS